MIIYVYILSNRYKIFCKNVDEIQERNEKSSTHPYGITKFTDQTKEEFSSQNSLNAEQIQKIMKSRNLENIVPRKVAKAPSSLDWRDKNVVSPVRNQNAVKCGSCYIHSALSAIESKYFIDSGNENSLSDQQLLDCDPSNTCNGGDPNEIPKYIAMEGKMCSRNEYPWVGKKESCKLSECKTVYEVPAYEFVSINPPTESALFDAVLQQPILITMSDELLQHYVSGVISDPCENNINHAALLIGYGKENGTDYWLIKNSYGEDWGEKGFFKLQRNSGDEYGKCKIAGGASLTSLRDIHENKGMDGGEVLLKIVLPVIVGLCLLIFVYYYFFKCYGCSKVKHESTGTRVKNNKKDTLSEI